MSDHGDAVRHWAEAENRLYPVINLRPDLYESAVGAVRALADHLAGVPDQDALVTSFTASTTAKDLMSESVVMVGPEEDVEVLAGLMVKEHVNPVPVVEDGRLVGVVSRADLIRWMTRDD